MKPLPSPSVCANPMIVMTVSSSAASSSTRLKPGGSRRGADVPCARAVTNGSRGCDTFTRLGAALLIHVLYPAAGAAQVRVLHTEPVVGLPDTGQLEGV